MSRDICKRFGARIKQLRESKKMSQITLAEKIGIEQPHLSNLENGKKEAKLRVVEMLAIGLKVSLSELFKGV
jgi:transcriptional regulator with XRE-family HTH domain